MAKNNFENYRIEVIKYIDQKKEMQGLLLNFIDNEKYFDEEFNQMVDFLNSIYTQSNIKELLGFLYLITNISINHLYIQLYLFFFFEKDIKQTFLKSHIFDIFQNNKRILILFLTKIFLTMIFAYVKNDDQNEMKYFRETKKLEKMSLKFVNIYEIIKHRWT